MKNPPRISTEILTHVDNIYSVDLTDLRAAGIEVVGVLEVWDPETDLVNTYQYSKKFSDAGKVSGWVFLGPRKKGLVIFND